MTAAFDERTYAFGETILDAGESALILVLEGQARAVGHLAGGSEITLRVIGPEDTFGERSLVEEEPPDMILRAMSSAVRVLRLDRAVALALARSHPVAAEGFRVTAEGRRIAAFLRVDSAFADLQRAAYELLVRHAREVRFEPGDVVIREGELSDRWWIVEEGRLIEHVGEGADRRELRFLRAGDVFGEVGALTAGVQQGSVIVPSGSILLDLATLPTRLSTVTAKTESALLELDSDALAELREMDPAFADRLEERASLQVGRTATRPLDFRGDTIHSGVFLAPAPPPSEDERMAAGARVSEDPVEAEPWTPPRRFPFVRQIDFADCGAASMAMVCRAFGHPVSLMFIRRAVGTGQDGTSLRGLQRGGDEAGLEVKALKASKDRVTGLPLPAVIHWEANHWVVLYEVGPDGVRIADPARGLRRVSRAELDEKWSGWSATFRPTERLAEAPLEHLDLSWLWPFVRPIRRVLAVAVVLAIVATGLQLVAPVLTQRVVDAAAGSDTAEVNLLLFLIVGLLLAALAVSLIQRRLLARAAVRLDGETLDFVAGRLLDLPLAYFEARQTADMERRLNGLRQVRSILVQGLVGGMTGVIQLLITLAIMISYSPLIALVFLAMAPAYAYLLRFSSKRLRPTFDGLEEAYSRHAAKQLDAIKGVETVKSAGAEDGIRTGMRREFGNLADRVFRGDWVIMAYDAGVQLASFLVFALFLWVGALLVASGDLTIGQLVAVNALVLLANGPIQVLLGLWDQVQQGSVLLQRLQDVLEAEPEQDREARRVRPVPRLSGRIALRDLGLYYRSAPDRAILSGITLTLEPGQTVGLVGRSGSGKSTLVRCLSGLLIPTSGSVLYDEVDLRELDWRALRRRIGVVLQQPYLFDDTIAANIALGEEVPDMAGVRRAAEIADAAGFIEAMALGYETKVGDSGLRVSGGQAQRISIARALYHDPPVLLFDEATSALDSESERAVKRNLDTVLQNRTAVVVAHRLSTIRDADVIAVLELGQLVEHGTHDELLERHGLYHHLHASQLA